MAPRSSDDGGELLGELLAHGVTTVAIGLPGGESEAAGAPEAAASGLPIVTCRDGQGPECCWPACGSDSGRVTATLGSEWPKGHQPGDHFGDLSKQIDAADDELVLAHETGMQQVGVAGVLVGKPVATYVPEVKLGFG
jgi:hypothetical protein